MILFNFLFGAFILNFKRGHARGSNLSLGIESLDLCTFCLRPVGANSGSDFVIPKFQVRQPGGLVLQKMAAIFSSASLVLWLFYACFDIYNSLFYVISIFLLHVLFFYLFYYFLC